MSASSSAMRHFNPRSPHGERQSVFRGNSYYKDFNPRSPHGERHPRDPHQLRLGRISIHAPRTGSDDLRKMYEPEKKEISIHAPRTGSDGFRRPV